jgi:hypothetical protein
MSIEDATANEIPESVTGTDAPQAVGEQPTNAPVDPAPQEQASPTETNHFLDGYINSLPEEQREKELKAFKNFKDVNGLAKSYRELQKKFSSGEHKKTVLADTPTPEELEAYRKENNIPTDYKEYKDEFVDNFQFSEDQQESLTKFKEYMHNANAPQSVYKAAVDAYIEINKQEALKINAQYQDMDIAAKQQLKAEYGLNFERNVNQVTGVLQQTFGEDWEKINNAIGPDGKPLLYDPNIFKGLYKIAQEMNPVGTLTGHNNVQSMQNRKAEIETYMKKNWYEYDSPAGKPMRDEYYNIIKAEENMKNKIDMYKK